MAVDDALQRETSVWAECPIRQVDLVELLPDPVEEAEEHFQVAVEEEAEFDQKKPREEAVVAVHVPSDHLAVVAVAVAVRRRWPSLVAERFRHKTDKPLVVRRSWNRLQTSPHNGDRQIGLGPLLLCKAGVQS